MAQFPTKICTKY